MARKSKARDMNAFFGCPKNCSGGRSRQRDITDGELNEVTGKDRKAADAKRSDVRRCSYCGVVYIRGYPPNQQPQVLGFLDDGVLGPGWHPLSKR